MRVCEDRTPMGGILKKQAHNPGGLCALHALDCDKALCAYDRSLAMRSRSSSYFASAFFSFSMAFSGVQPHFALFSSMGGL